MINDGMNDLNLPCQCDECKSLREAHGRDSRTGEEIPVMESVEEEDIFRITASDWTDHDDGSATVILEMSKNTVQFFAQQGILNALAGVAKTAIESSNS